MAKSLEPQQREDIIRMHLDGVPKAEIARQLGIGHVAVGVHILRWESEQAGNVARGRTMQIDDMKQLTPHPLCLAYPQLSDEALDIMGQDIQRNGQQHPVLTQGGFIYDGRNRWLACLRLGIPMLHQEIPDGTDLEALVRSLNDMRRHQQSPSQRAMRAADQVEQEGVTMRVAAAQHDVGPSSVCSAVKVKAIDPAVADEVRRGDITVREAERKVGIGQTRVNGVLRDDPPDIAAKRAAGKIGQGVIPEVDEEDAPTTLEGIREEQEERAAIQADIPDDEWLAGLPLMAVLTGPQQKRFRTAALRFRHLEEPRRTFQWHASREFGKGGANDPYSYLVKRLLAVEPPDRWKRCPEPIEGGCSGEGVMRVGDKDYPCPKCHGNGFWINS